MAYGVEKIEKGFQLPNFEQLKCTRAVDRGYNIIFKEAQDSLLLLPVSVDCN